MATGQGRRRGRALGGLRNKGCIDDVYGASRQDADAAYTVKVELQAKVDSLDKVIEFLKCVYDAVSAHLSSTFLPLQLKAPDLPKWTPAGGT